MIRNTLVKSGAATINKYPVGQVIPGFYAFKLILPDMYLILRGDPIRLVKKRHLGLGAVLKDGPTC